MREEVVLIQKTPNENDTRALDGGNSDRTSDLTLPVSDGMTANIPVKLYGGGHLLASIFGGPGEKVSLVPQHMFQNRGAGPSNVPDVPREDLEVWHKVETDVRAELNTHGSHVKVDWEAQPVYEGANEVPSRIDLTVSIDGKRPRTYHFVN